MIEQAAAIVAQPRKRLIAASPFVWRHPSSIPPREWLYGRHYIRRFLSATVAPGAAGKSSLILAEAIAMASGRPLLGVKVQQPLRVWVWNGEDPLEELQRRVGAIMLHFGIDPIEIAGNLFLDSGRVSEMIIASGAPGGALIHSPVVDAVIAAIIEWKIDVFSVDPFISSHLVNENDNGQIGAVAKTWARIADSTRAAVELVHHLRKGLGDGDRTADDARGAGALVAAARSVRVINTMTKKEAEKFGVDQPRSYFRVDDGKANLAPLEAARWHRLTSVDLGNSTEERQSDHVAVVEEWKRPDPFSEVTIHHLREVQKRVAAGAARRDAQSAAWVGIIVADVIGIDLGDVAGRGMVKSIVAKWIENDVLRVVEKEDKGRVKRKYVVAGVAV
ncbi:AAA family ATPase [Bradyrhizobium sp. U87765 SZCCT0131]|uniref:AAA family ATPase n=1 Tax=unclassified Bradyrhizobium TaxID=2631580 RepID=UPI001BA7336B|nr:MULTISPECIES: AAA family ATPase [unclassified Bradyrhizobium]MBR1216520.1 AAA family ATPase [Bradyrhizobium sp. U87765 SZCCT0131]MBR1259724.1 AAA family ATPase [Bradyrhizobium sp. U87765 SZCCT0134]MBR1305865.1 AAA family ATPase [Bradyrhizobium sp. U87765 SZCCT0110]MBR1322232.1 AAA family ATPase [Bradyrhizobium sp. U87765 SZCCT0109]MBR1350489.1 AAA family ATPase [Bradyrhizobium sp. U87765 SZCCT0048]